MLGHVCHVRRNGEGGSGLRGRVSGISSLGVQAGIRDIHTLGVGQGSGISSLGVGAEIRDILCRVEHVLITTPRTPQAWAPRSRSWRARLGGYPGVH